MKSNWYWRVFPGDFPQQICLFQIILNHLKNSVLTPQGVCSWHKMANFFYCQNFLPDLKGVFSRDWPGISSPPAITWYRNHTIYTRSVFLWWSKMHLKDFLRNCKKGWWWWWRWWWWSSSSSSSSSSWSLIMLMQSDAVRWPSKAIFFPFETFSSEQQKKQAAGSFCKFALKLCWKNMFWFHHSKFYSYLTRNILFCLLNQWLWKLVTSLCDFARREEKWILAQLLALTPGGNAMCERFKSCKNIKCTSRGDAEGKFHNNLLKNINKYVCVAMLYSLQMQHSLKLFFYHAVIFDWSQNWPKRLGWVFLEF